MQVEAPRVLLIRRRYLGDIVLLGSVARNLRLHWPDAHLAILTETPYIGIAPLNPDFNAAITFPRRLGEWPAFLRALRAARFTHVLDFDNTEKTALLTRFTGATTRVAFDRELIVFRYPRLYTHAAKVTNAFYDSHHITSTYLEILRPLGVPVASNEVRLVPPLAAVESARKLAPRGGRKVLLHPGSRSAFRIWPAERFAAVCDRLQDELDAQVFLIAGPAEQELVQQIRSHARSHLVAIERSLPVGEFAALAAQFDVFLCHDSGPMHLAAAVGTPVVALFGSQNSTIWRPLGDRHAVLQAPLPCSCLGKAAPTPCVKGDGYRSYCVRKITETEVFAAVAARLTSETR
jgi:ADP-heptose:LPS heptosyltransferase